MTNIKYDNTEWDRMKFYSIRSSYLPEVMIYAFKRDYKDTNLFNTFIQYLKELHIYMIEQPSNIPVIIMVLLYPVLLISDICEQWIPYYNKEMMKPEYSKNDELNRYTQNNPDQNSRYIYNEEHTDLIEVESFCSRALENREKQGTLSDNYCPDKKKKASRAEVINSLRKYLYQNNLTLKCNKIENKLTFGSDIDNSLKYIFNNLDLTDIEIIKNKLKQLYQMNVSITVVSDKVNAKVNKGINYELLGKILGIGILILYHIIELLIYFA